MVLGSRSVAVYLLHSYKQNLEINQRRCVAKQELQASIQTLLCIIDGHTLTNNIPSSCLSDLSRDRIVSTRLFEMHQNFSKVETGVQVKPSDIASSIIEYLP
jgi:hypothetical protein